MSEVESLKLSFLQKVVFSEYLEDDEIVYYFVQNHWFMYFVTLFKMALIFIPSLFVLLIWGTSNPYVFLGALGSTLISATLLGIGWYNLYADAFILTDKNIIFVEWDSLVSIKSSRISYGEIESASAVMEGFFPTLLGYGDLRIETANEKFTPELKNAAHVGVAEKQILMHKEHHGRNDGKIEAELLKNAIKGIVDEYILEKKNEVKEEEVRDEFEARFGKYKIRGPRFHQHEGKDEVLDQSDLKEDRFEQYRLKRNELDEENEDNSDQDDLDKRFKRFREKK